LQPLSSPVYRLKRAFGATIWRAGPCAWSALLVGCTTVDPGTNFVVADVTFDADYFYCHVEPQYIFANNCGPGDSKYPPNSCHFNPAAVSGMGLIDHAAVDCDGGDHPVDLTQIGTGSPPQSNYVAVSSEMSRDYTVAPLLVRPSGNGHVTVINPQDPTVVTLLSTWAQ
jgi:hypothetical protein